MRRMRSYLYFRFVYLITSYNVDMGDFIVDDRTGAPPTRPSKRIVHKDAALQQAQNIFGVDFDLSEFEAFRKSRVGGDDYSDESEYEYSDEEEGSKARRSKHRRAPSNLVMDDRVYELFDPSDLERAYYSQADERIRKTDVPERFQLRQVPVKYIDSCSATYTQDLQELSDEAEWIYRHAFKEDAEYKVTIDFLTYFIVSLLELYLKFSSP